jgi:nicotinamidase-related amidase
MTTETPAPIDPATTALLVMDYQNGVFELVENSATLLGGAKEAIARVRSSGGTVGYVRVGFADGEAPGGMMGERIGREAAQTMFHADAPHHPDPR